MGTLASPKAPPRTVVEVHYPARLGQIGLRGSGPPLSWESTTAPTRREGDVSVFELDLKPGQIIELKLVRNEEEWAHGRNYALHPGDHLLLEPCFDCTHGKLLEPETLSAGGQELGFQVLLPPSYDEQESKRYPVLYAFDGQALWSSSSDPYGIWHLDTTLGQLWDIGAVDEVIVVAVNTADRRIERLSPVKDAHHGGGEGPALLSALVDHLLPLVNGRFRTRADREHTGLLGSSMGGLFSFFAAWTRPEIFGKAACLSSSFWWADRHVIRAVQSGAPPSPRPQLYVDSGAAISALEANPQIKDGFHHTRAMLRALVSHGYTRGVDLHGLTFPGQSHDTSAWGARVAIPLQLLFPPEMIRPRQVPQPRPSFGQQSASA